MIITLKIIFLIVAVVIFALAALTSVFVAPDARYSRWNLIALGLFFYAAKDLLA